MEYITLHQGESWFLLGCLLLVLDMTLFGFASGVLLFVGIGGVITGGLMMIGIIPETVVAGIASLGVSSVASAAILWKPLKKLQKKGPVNPGNTSDFIGHEFVLADEITRQLPGSVRYSGIKWRVEIAPGAQEQSIAGGTRVSVVSLDAGVFRVMSI